MKFETEMKKSKEIIKLILITILVIIFLFSFYIFFIFDIKIEFYINQIQTLIESLGIYGILVFIFLMALAIVISPIPSLPLAGIAGVVFGVYLGTIYSVIGATIGAIISFLIARFLGREYIANKFGKESLFLEKYSENNLAIIIFIMRMIPFFQFDIVSYGSGLTKIRLWKFILATSIGMIPMTFLFVKSGDLILNNNIFGIVFIILIILGMYFVSKYLKSINIR